MFESKIVELGALRLPEPTGVRVQMLPFVYDDVRRSLPPEVAQYADLVERITRGASSGVGYLTVDEAYVEADTTQRRPGRHVDGGRATDGWGGGGWGGSRVGGMVLISSVYGCRGWAQDVDGEPGPEGDCSHLTMDDRALVPMRPGVAYWCNPKAVHESVPMRTSGIRQFVRVSTPSTACIHEGESVNRLGVVPNVEVQPRRAFMNYRPELG